MRRTVVIGVGAVVALLVGCGGSSSKMACVPGASVACVATTGCSGAQVCKTDGTGYEACVCGTGTGGSGAGGNAAGTGGTAGAAGASATGSGGAAGAAGAGTGGAAGVGGAAGAASGPPISGLTIWLDASKGVTLMGHAVTAWADQSGSGEDATATAATAPMPTVETAGNDIALQFTTGGNTMMTVATAAGTDWESGPFLLEFVLRNTTAAGTVGEFWSNGVGQKSLALGCNDGMTTVPDLWMLAYASIGSSSLNSGNSVSYNDGSLHSIGVWRDSGSNISLLVDGVAVMTQSLAGPISTSGGATLGSFDGNLFEVLGKNGAVTSSDVAAVESYFHAKYGTP